ncbi:class II glutamine amidotransferase [Chitinivorax sp. B]|uniref:class II glutamine amidotransferase n=1 Tax=Chitinivorax sp. B TaxID=2502235 RepID=UPI0010F73B4B|nr:class II glutamine amidotransferase [Chitinivorax sp. B]
MCQLLGMNCNVPTDICFSFTGFACRGGRTDEHRDGWGIAFFEDKGCRVFRDYLASSESPIAELVSHYPIKSTNVIAHIRKATQGEINLVNTHPFQRELWGKYWVFAHNGNLERLPELPTHYYRSVGTTDSERAFCLLLEQLRHRYDEEPAANVLFETVKEIAGELAQHGTFNFMLSNGEWLFAHCSTHLHYIIRRAPFCKAHLLDEDVTVDFAQVTKAHDQVAVIATQPLTDNESWIGMESGELIGFHQGQVAWQATTVSSTK